jgi:RNA 3'-terminal phosphate cyclase
MVSGRKTNAMITIDGSQGEGGGQILRTSLGLSLVTGTHNLMAPPFDFLEKCFMPLIHRMGP